MHTQFFKPNDATAPDVETASAVASPDIFEDSMEVGAKIAIHLQDCHIRLKQEESRAVAQKNLEAYLESAEIAEDAEIANDLKNTYSFDPEIIRTVFPHAQESSIQYLLQEQKLYDVFNKFIANLGDFKALSLDELNIIRDSKLPEVQGFLTRHLKELTTSLDNAHALNKQETAHAMDQQAPTAPISTVRNTK